MLSDHRVSVEVSGAGILQAVGSGSPLPEEPYDGACCTTYQGRIQIIIRAGRVSGDIKVKITSPDLEEKQVTIRVK